VVLKANINGAKEIICSLNIFLCILREILLLNSSLLQISDCILLLLLFIIPHNMLTSPVASIFTIIGSILIVIYLLSVMKMESSCNQTKTVFHYYIQLIYTCVFLIKNAQHIV